MASIRTRTDKTGKRTYQVRGNALPTKTFQRRRDAELYADQAERRSRLGPLFQVEPETLAEALDVYFEFKSAASWRASTLRTNESIRRGLDPLADRSLLALNRDTVARFLGAFAKTGKRREAQKVQALLCAVLKDAHARGQRIDAGILAIPRVKVETRDPVVVTPAQLDLIASCIVPPWLAEIVPVAGLTGMRRGELLALEDGDLHLDEGYLWVRGGKTDNARRKVYLADPVVARLRRHLLERPAFEGGTRYVFPNPSGSAWDGSNFMGRVFIPAREWAASEDQGVADVTFHDLRHTAISLMAKAGLSVELIAKQVGHGDGGALILKRYRHLYPDELGAAMASFGAYVDTATNDGRQVDTGRTG